MAFASINFIIYFLPLTLLLYFVVSQFKSKMCNSLLLSASSLYFYGYISPSFLILLIISVLFNFFFSVYIQNSSKKYYKKIILQISIFVNLLYLFAFKYITPLFILMGQYFENDLSEYYVPFLLGVSFFTFQQITYLIQSYENQVSENRFWVYLNFVAFFPYILSGPITRYTEIGKTISNLRPLRSKNLLIGLSIFGIGLFKKTVIAENLRGYSDILFNSPLDNVSFYDAWIGVLAFTFQVYFDFSAYTDMAIGLARCFGIILPINFFSPYKALSVGDFWKRWHMTMTRFFTDFIYTPLAMKLTRKALFSRMPPVKTFLISVAFPSIFTFVLVGFWHEAGWTFLLFGLMHGLALSLNQYWKTKIKIALPKTLSWGITFVFVVFSLVLFRAPDLASTFAVWEAMTLGIFTNEERFNLLGHSSFIWVCLSLGLCLTLPNVYQVFRKYTPGQKPNFILPKPNKIVSLMTWRASPGYVLIVGALFALGVVKTFGASISSFVYLQF